MKRILFLICCTVVLIGLMAITGLAASDIIDYNDYVTDVVVDGDNDIVTVTIPSDMSGVFLYSSDISLLASGQSITYNYSPGERLYLTFRMLNDDKFDLTNIPNGTVITYYYTVSFGATSSFNNSGVNVITQYFNSNFEYISQQITPVDEVWVNPRVSSVTINRPAGASCFYSYLAWDALNSSSSGTLRASLSHVTMTFSISSLYRLQQESGKTNKLLEDIAGYAPEVDTPEGGEAVGDVGDIESGLIEDVSGGLDELGSTMEGTLAVLGKYANSLFAVAWLMGKVFDISEFNDLVSVSLGLSVIVLLFSVSLTVSSSISRRSRSSGSKASGKGGGKK